MNKYSLVPEMMSEKKIKFKDNNNTDVIICRPSPFRYIIPFRTPYINYDSFADKTTKPSEIKNIDLEELKNLKYMVTSIPAGNKRWFSNQKVIYRIELISDPSPGSKKIVSLPSNHKILKDIANKKVRLIGPNAWPKGDDGRGWKEYGL